MNPYTRVRNYFRLVAEDRELSGTAQAVKPLLSFLSFFYGKAVVLLQALYQKGMLPRKRLPFPVISVGNLTWGGTGKTPLVEYLARRIVERRKNPLILSRGYSMDEINQLKDHLPNVKIGVGKERYKVARGISRNERIHVAILDDGFQHWKIQRDIEIVAINALNPFGNGQLIPRGVLREPKEALKRAAIILLTHVNLVGVKELENLRAEFRRLSPNASLVEAYIEPLFLYRAARGNRLSLEQLGNRRVATFSAVANPRSFQLLLAKQGIKPVRNFEYGDHHVFTQPELEEIRLISTKSEVDEIITTEKDFFRSQKTITETLNPLVLAARLRIASGEEILTDRMFRLLGVN